jgi:hypothetical protein
MTTLLVAKLQSGVDEVVAFFDRIESAELARPLTTSQHPGGRHWSARHHLAHLVQRELDFLPIAHRVIAQEADPVRLAKRGATAAERVASVNRENQEVIELRATEPVKRLLAELVRARAALVA